MNEQVELFYPILLYLVLIVGFIITTLVLAHMPRVKPYKDTQVKSMPYESGMDPVRDARQHFDVKFYLVAILFLIFDIELLFLYPWAVSMYAAQGGVPPELRNLVLGAVAGFMALVAIVTLAGSPIASAISLTLEDSYYLGSVAPGTPADDDHEAAFINYLAGMTPGSSESDVEVIPGAPPDDNNFARSDNDFGVLPLAVFDFKNDAGTPLSFDLTGSTMYVLAKYGQGSAVWFVNGYVGEVTVLTTFNGKGLSHTSFFGGTTSVPDTGATLALLGAGLLMVSWLARRGA